MLRLQMAEKRKATKTPSKTGSKTSVTKNRSVTQRVRIYTEINRRVEQLGLGVETRRRSGDNTN